MKHTTKILVLIFFVFTNKGSHFLIDGIRVYSYKNLLCKNVRFCCVCGCRIMFILRTGSTTIVVDKLYWRYGEYGR